METCQRCGEEGEDRRTLWMACFYKMSELDLPFESKTLFHVDNQTLALAKPPSDLVLDDGTSIRIQAETVTSEGELYPQQFYTLRVCKQCRGEWLEAIKKWFNRYWLDLSGNGNHARRNTR